MSERQTLEGWVPSLASDDEAREAFEKAFDYRGDVTLTLKDGKQIEGYVYDRRVGKTLEDSAVRMLPKDNSPRVTIPYAQIARLEFSGRDTAAGKSFETWIKKYNEKKAAGETNISLHPEALE
jgi:hypothetical protein